MISDGRAPSGGGNRLVGLELLRGFAVLLVMLRHSWPETFGSAGIVGVVAFFALSGYLITGLLMRDLHTHGRIRYKRFYIHRAFRLIPALLFLLAGFSVITVAWSPADDRDSIGKSLFYALTYTMNTPGSDKGSPALNHLWTLATEEQFYLLWPIVLALGIRIARATLVTVLSTVGVTIACTFTLFFLEKEPLSVYTWPTSWAVTMLIGAIGALERERIERCLQAGARMHVRGVSAAVGFGVICSIAAVPELRTYVATYLVVGPVIALCSVALIFCLNTWTELPTKALRPLAALGTVSYSAYLWNGAIQYWVGPRPFTPVQAVGLFLMTIVAATVSWWVIEAPLGRLRKRFDGAVTNRAAADETTTKPAL